MSRQAETQAGHTGTLNTNVDEECEECHCRIFPWARALVQRSGRSDVCPPGLITDGECISQHARNFCKEAVDHHLSDRCWQLRKEAIQGFPSRGSRSSHISETSDSWVFACVHWCQNIAMREAGRRLKIKAHLCSFVKVERSGGQKTGGPRGCRRIPYPHVTLSLVLTRKPSRSAWWKV